jgi:UDP-N-acetylmuramoyl-tripeptide--D-alanyl-D-alanine ligase
VWLINDVIRAVKGTAYRVEKNAFSGVSTDSRTIGPDELFVPLTGPNFDGHRFIDAAYARSHGGSICDRSRPEIYEKSQGTVVLVESADQALLDLASYKRTRTSGDFVAITGSNGKTTTKELLVHLVGDRFPIVFNERNYNNQVGVAHAILAIEGHPRYGIFEIGTNHKGEIAVLARMVKPALSLVTNVNLSHLEGLSDINGVRDEKVSLFKWTRKGGKIFVNVDDPLLAAYARRSSRGKRHITCTFGMREQADFRLTVVKDYGIDGFRIRLDFPDETIETRTGLIGYHNLYNVLAASALAHSLGIEGGRLRDAIPGFVPYNGRFRAFSSRCGYTVIDDSYNANPASMEWAINTLTALPCDGKKIAIIGAMRELGERKDFYHRELGHLLRSSGIPMVLLFGEDTRIALDEMQNGQARFFDDKKKLVDFVSGKIGTGDIVLVKGSRALRMDEIVEALV